MLATVQGVSKWNVHGNIHPSDLNPKREQIPQKDCTVYSVPIGCRKCLSNMQFGRRGTDMLAKNGPPKFLLQEFDPRPKKCPLIASIMKTRNHDIARILDRTLENVSVSIKYFTRVPK